MNRKITSPTNRATTASPVTRAARPVRRTQIRNGSRIRHQAPHPADNEIQRQEERKAGSSFGQHIESGPDDLVTPFGAVPKRPCPQEDAYLALDAHASAPWTPRPRRLAAARNVAARWSASFRTAESPLPVMP